MKGTNRPILAQKRCDKGRTIKFLLRKNFIFLRGLHDVIGELIKFGGGMGWGKKGEISLLNVALVVKVETSLYDRGFMTLPP